MTPKLRNLDRNDILDSEFVRTRRTDWIALNKTRVLLTDDRLSTNVRANILRTTTLPAVLYACETWSTTKRDEEKSAVAEKAMERRTCGVTTIDRINNEELRRRTALREVDPEIYAAKKRWVGHAARRSDNRWTCRLTEWIHLDRKLQLCRLQTRWVSHMYGSCRDSRI
ncbi:Putative uncharacterized transposon-derived protein F52C9.6, partial [Toxocara canis]